MSDHILTCCSALLVAGCTELAPGSVDAAAGLPDAITAAPDAAPLAPPTWSNEMTTAGASDFYTRTQPDGSVDLDVPDPDATDGRVARLRFPGIPALANPDRVSPAFATELATTRTTFHHGTYRMRVKLASCAAGEEVVNGLFTYFNDGTDHDGDGIVDNSEIDIEILCGTPAVLFLSVWTDYTFATETFRKQTRAIDLTTGDLWASPSDHEYGLIRVGNDPALQLPALLDPATFVELGFTWQADRVRYFATIDGTDRTLWELTDPTQIPTLPASVMFNVWHPAEHWFGGGNGSPPPDYPAQDATLLVDWVRYWED